MRLLLELEKSFHQLQGMAYVKSIDGGDTIVVVLRGDLHSSPQQVASLRKKLSEKLGKNVRLVEDSQDVGKFIENLVAPARIVAMNKIWLPDNSMEMRIILDSERHLRLGVALIRDIVMVVKGVPLRVDFERRWGGPSRPVHRRSKRLPVNVQENRNKN